MATIMSDVRNAASEMEQMGIFSKTGYPTELPATIMTSHGNRVIIDSGYSNIQQFCIIGTHDGYEDLFAYYSSEERIVRESMLTCGLVPVKPGEDEDYAQVDEEEYRKLKEEESKQDNSGGVASPTPTAPSEPTPTPEPTDGHDHDPEETTTPTESSDPSPDPSGESDTGAGGGQTTPSETTAPGETSTPGETTNPGGTGTGDSNDPETVDFSIPTLPEIIYDGKTTQPAPEGYDKKNRNKFDICHNGNKLTLPITAILHGHSHHAEGKDIIPLIPGYHPGQNWNAAGASIWKNHCVGSNWHSHSH